jgi:uncharacterized protein YjiS (DUF1127 family)
MPNGLPNEIKKRVNGLRSKKRSWEKRKRTRLSLERIDSDRFLDGQSRALL